MAESKVKKTSGESRSGVSGLSQLTTKQRLLAEFSRAAQDASLDERLTQLGIPVKERSDAVSLAVSVLLERIDDISRELTNARDDFDQLEQMVDVDCLAPVPNRRAFMRRLEWAVSMFKRYGHPCSISFFDLNGFKAINDEHGHAAGDEVIRTVANVLTESMRESDFMARLGGDEFVVLLYHAKHEAAQKRTNLIARRIAEHTFVWKKTVVPISASCGTYEIAEGDTAETALAHADEAMYAHKKALQS